MHSSTQISHAGIIFHADSEFKVRFPILWLFTFSRNKVWNQPLYLVWVICLNKSQGKTDNAQFLSWDFGAENSDLLNKIAITMQTAESNEQIYELFNVWCPFNQYDTPYVIITGYDCGRISYDSTVLWQYPGSNRYYN